MTIYWSKIRVIRRFYTLQSCFKHSKMGATGTYRGYRMLWKLVAKKLESLGYPTVKPHHHTTISFCTVPASDGQTDGRTDGHVTPPVAKSRSEHDKSVYRLLDCRKNPYLHKT